MGRRGVISSFKLFLPALLHVEEGRQRSAPCSSHPGLEAEFLDIIETKTLPRVFLLLFILTNGFYPPPPPPPSKSVLKLVCNVNIVCGILKPANSQDYAKKHQRNCPFMNSASKLSVLNSSVLGKMLRISKKLLHRKRGGGT